MKSNVASTLHWVQPKCNERDFRRWTNVSIEGAGRCRPAPYRDSDPPDPSAGIECFTVTDDEKSTVSPSVEDPKASQ